MKPDKIFVCGIEEGEHREGYTDIHTAEFCLEREWKMDIEYIRADIHEMKLAEIAKLKAAGERLAGMLYSASFHLTGDDCVIINNAIDKWKETANE